MVNALIIGNTILDRAFKEDKDITPMKLQKLIFCLYKEYYKSTGRALFDERFEAWKYGPVLRSVYDEFKSSGSNSIKRFSISDDGKVYVADTSSSPLFREAFDKVWENYSDYDGIVLSSFTHKSNTAWRKAIDKRKIYLDDNDIAGEEDYIVSN
ncbi:MAG: DUF4065 domain-containing protein [Enterocloster clostridioformis]|uniref:Panacea domain-containing protein n=1 Tax=Enterocloster clostridioformis TaxID=1531 RepID=UPI000489178D|nr:type II toxin-antitoxin system antitoxin SocA domain-containing protein [Enterocloster clostridioformis]MCI6124674.1 DUF4065 domain-containing protein [Enterocloster clostridioformis]MDY4764863.1 DUF4065 domain-containing protein [Enterocloster clostridioformis]